MRRSPQRRRRCDAWVLDLKEAARDREQLRRPRAPTQNRASALLDGRISPGVCGLPRDHSQAQVPGFLVFVVFGLAAATLSAGHVQSLIRIQFSPTLRPINSWCLQSAHVYARFILVGTFMILVALAWDVRSRAERWASLGCGRDVARRHRPIRRIPIDVLSKRA